MTFPLPPENALPHHKLIAFQLALELEKDAVALIDKMMQACVEEGDTATREWLAPKMLEEHVRIHAAVADLRAAAEAAGAEAQVELADELALHARTEEEVLYPAALLVGDLLRAREQQR